ncbi:glutaryl-CoA dehydrogenase, putative [Rhizoctonia solani AG-3 Rhs1AP]|uniref:Glutaryl-CoA dehydrogenase, putative n=1 Tax=Rhizoctonia solani AG-3 Rhs1AP TaxID=1086054 RepID=X8J551_9AGAM|nr:glutaryl-CoA dehydrogenase, putative [Rhizoctonia solani AG-3 Rhs1AP]
MTTPGTAVSTTSAGNNHSRRKLSPQLRIDVANSSNGPAIISQSGTPSAGIWYRPELPEEAIPLNLGAETSWDGTKGISVAQGRQRSNTVVGATFASLGTSPCSMTGLYTRDAEMLLQPPPNSDGVSSAYGYDAPMGSDFDDELTRRLLREKRHLTEEGRWVDDGDIGSIVSRRTVPDDQDEIALNLLCNICFQNLGDMCFTRCKHIFCSSDLDEYIRRSLRPGTLELACPACGLTCTYGRDVISVATGRPTGPIIAADERLLALNIRRDSSAKIPQPVSQGFQIQTPLASTSLPQNERPHLKSIKQRSIDHTRKAKASHLPSPPITPATLPISLYEQRASSSGEKARQTTDKEVRVGLVGTIERVVGEQFSRVLSILALALVLWVLVK